MTGMRYLGGTLCALLLATAARAEPPYSAADFEHARKFDAHVHANTTDGFFLKVAAQDGFKILSINVDYPDFPPLPVQADIAHTLQSRDPQRFHFVTTFPVTGFGGTTWTEDTIRRVDAEIQRGALGVKVWKNIGMVAKDAQGQFIRLDDPRFDGVMSHLEARGVPLIAHQAEPKNCW